MKVLKFGGTSVGTIESLRNVKRIVEGLAEPSVVVVSALGGLTDKLIATARDAAAGRGDFNAEMKAISRRHHDIIDAMVPAEYKQCVEENVDALLAELGNLYLGISLINELPERTYDRIVSFGERMSSMIVAAIISNAEHKDSLRFIKTERWMDKNIADRDTIDMLVKESFPLPLTRHVVTGGFISRDRDTDAITNLGRGGSDFTAALIAAALDAESLDIWTDVDGFMTADPRIIPEAQVIPRMTFVESMELCSFGAKVIYPPTIYPVFHKNIPIRILNTHNPSAPGTLITDNVKGLPDCVRGVSSVRNTGMITIVGAAVNQIADINSRSYNAMARAGINVLVVTRDHEQNFFSVIVKAEECNGAMEALRTEFAPELGNKSISSLSMTENLAVLAIVKEGIRDYEGLSARLYNTLRQGGVRIHGMTDGSSEATVAIVVSDEDAIKALELAHDAVIPVPGC